MTETTPQTDYKSDSSYGYGKRPLWQWILLYVIIGGAIYGLVYYFVFAKKGGYSYNSASTDYTTASTEPGVSTQPYASMQPYASTQPAASATPADAMHAVVTTGKFLTAANGMTIYVFDKDQPGVSNCTGSCATMWPPLMAVAGTTKLPANLTIIQRPDGSSQYAWKNRPVYYYFKDAKPGDITGDGVQGTWHLVKP